MNFALEDCALKSNACSLHTGLRDYAITSAFHDSRFDPVRKEEIPHLHCGVSLLIKFESAHDYMDWTIGMHGIRIHFMDGSVRRDAVYLPEVAYEQGWDHLETINNLIEKGGYRGRIDEGFRLSLQVTRFQSSKIMISYDNRFRAIHTTSHDAVRVANGEGKKGDGEAHIVLQCNGSDSGKSLLKEIRIWLQEPANASSRPALPITVALGAPPLERPDGAVACGAALACKR
ncbi:AMMECR1 protein, partial [Teladorsagia circumcincta]